jgi:hypothetical protein
MTIYLRGVRHKDQLSDAIIMNTGGVLAHFEGVMKGGTVVGAFAEGGVQERKLDYDGGNFAIEILFELQADDEMSAKFEHYLRAPEVIGEKYDYPGIANFLHLGVDLHAGHHVFCSALIHDALRGCNYLFRPMPIPGHYVTPLILHQELLARPDVRIVTRDDPAFVAHIRAEAG